MKAKGFLIFSWMFDLRHAILARGPKSRISLVYLPKCIIHALFLAFFMTQKMLYIYIYMSFSFFVDSLKILDCFGTAIKGFPVCQTIIFQNVGWLMLMVLLWMCVLCSLSVAVYGCLLLLQCKLKGLNGIPESFFSSQCHDWQGQFLHVCSPPIWLELACDMHNKASIQNQCKMHENHIKTHQHEKRTTNKVLNSHRININKMYMNIYQDN